MKNTRKSLQKIRAWEEEIAYATPKRAAKLVVKIVRLKSAVFDENRGIGTR